ncbi:hypothetical protein G9A89_010228 [Geosiphon pyriformis]|nr:hypothetical protein G9A89_010228 [Geosiphon pyriformis]
MIAEREPIRKFSSSSHQTQADKDKYTDELHADHYFLRELYGNNIYAFPLKKELRVGIDVCNIGCGAGTWICEMAANFSHSRFQGLDDAEFYPIAVKPKNAVFDYVRKLHHIPILDQSYDYVRYCNYASRLSGSQKAFEPILHEMERLTRKYGWIEVIVSNKEALDCIIECGKLTKEIEIFIWGANIVNSFLRERRVLDLLGFMWHVQSLGDISHGRRRRSISLKRKDAESPLTSLDRAYEHIEAHFVKVELCAEHVQKADEVLDGYPQEPYG